MISALWILILLLWIGASVTVARAGYAQLRDLVCLWRARRIQVDAAVPAARIENGRGFAAPRMRLGPGPSLVPPAFLGTLLLSIGGVSLGAPIALTCWMLLR